MGNCKQLDGGSVEVEKKEGVDKYWRILCQAPPCIFVDKSMAAPIPDYPYFDIYRYTVRGNFISGQLYFYFDFLKSCAEVCVYTVMVEATYYAYANLYPITKRLVVK